MSAAHRARAAVVAAHVVAHRGVLAEGEAVADKEDLDGWVLGQCRHGGAKQEAGNKHSAGEESHSSHLVNRRSPIRFTLPLLMLEIHGRYPRFGGALSYIQFVNEHLDWKVHGRRSSLFRELT